MSQLNEQITINVGGRMFTTYLETLLNYPDTLLGRMYSKDQVISHSKVPFFDRSDDLFDHILNFYRTGILSCPPYISKHVWDSELDFWNIPSDSSEGSNIIITLNSICESIELLNDKIDKLQPVRSPTGVYECNKCTWHSGPNSPTSLL